MFIEIATIPILAPIFVEEVIGHVDKELMKHKGMDAWTLLVFYQLLVFMCIGRLLGRSNKF